MSLHLAKTACRNEIKKLIVTPSKLGIHGVHFEKCPPEYESLLEGFTPLRPRLKNERKSDIIEIMKMDESMILEVYL
jgi:hypothetical protein